MVIYGPAILAIMTILAIMAVLLDDLMAIIMAKLGVDWKSRKNVDHLSRN